MCRVWEGTVEVCVFFQSELRSRSHYKASSVLQLKKIYVKLNRVIRKALIAHSCSIHLHSCGLSLEHISMGAGIAMGWKARVRFSVGVRDFLCPTATRATLQFTQPPIQWAHWSIPRGIKRPGREADYSPPCSAEMKNGVSVSPFSHLSVSPFSHSSPWFDA
jgi:hypothetical protein